MALYYSRVTKKGQATIPSVFRKRFAIGEGRRVVFEETDHGLLLRPAADIEDSAGTLSRFAEAGRVLDRLLSDRKKGFR